MVDPSRSVRGDTVEIDLRGDSPPRDVRGELPVAPPTLKETEEGIEAAGAVEAVGPRTRFGSASFGEDHCSKEPLAPPLA